MREQDRPWTERMGPLGWKWYALRIAVVIVVASIAGYIGAMSWRFALAWHLGYPADELTCAGQASEVQRRCFDHERTDPKTCQAIAMAIHDACDLEVQRRRWDR